MIINVVKRDWWNEPIDRYFYCHNEINARENRKVKKEWAIHRYSQHWAKETWRRHTKHTQKNKRENTVYLFLLWALVRANKASTIDGRNLVDPSTLPLLTCLYWRSVNLWISFFFLFFFFHQLIFVLFQKIRAFESHMYFQCFSFWHRYHIVWSDNWLSHSSICSCSTEKNPKQVSMIMDIQSNLP